MECLTVLVYNSIVVWSALIGPLGPIAAGIYATMGTFRVTFCLLAAAETMVVRILVLRVWKRHPPINEYFFASFAAMMNTTLSVFYALTAYMTNGQLRQQWILMGKNPDDIPDDLLRFRITGFLVLANVALSLAFGLDYLFK